jgi:hypothetical protein
MGAKDISDEEILDLGIETVGKTDSGSRKLKVPANALENYKNLIREKLTLGFWNAIVGEKEIIFIFKFEDSRIKEYVLSSDNEEEISRLCSEFNKDPLEKTANVYKYISGNEFYRDFMLKHYRGLMERGD